MTKTFVFNVKMYEHAEIAMRVDYVPIVAWKMSVIDVAQKVVLKRLFMIAMAVMRENVVSNMPFVMTIVSKNIVRNVDPDLS